MRKNAIQSIKYSTTRSEKLLTRIPRQKFAIFGSVCGAEETMCWSSRTSSTLRPSSVVIFASAGSRRRSLTTHSTWPRLSAALSTSFVTTSTGHCTAKHEMPSATWKYQSQPGDLQRAGFDTNWMNAYQSLDTVHWWQRYSSTTTTTRKSIYRPFVWHYLDEPVPKS